MKDPTDRIDGTDARLLASVPGSDTAERTWSPDDLAAVWRDQLSAPAWLDLGNVDPAFASKLRTLCSSRGLLLKCFGDLLRHPHPPVELLAMVKDLAKQSRRDPRSPLPREVATALYYSCIAVALTKCGTKITRMDNETLAHGLSWVLSRDWVDDDIISIAKMASDGIRRAS